MANHPPLVDMDKMFRASTIFEQQRQAASALEAVLAGSAFQGVGAGAAFEVCDGWQQRFQKAVCSPIPNHRTGLAAFRCITDYIIPEEAIETILPPRPAQIPITCSQPLKTVEDLWYVYHHYIELEQDDVRSKQVVEIGSALEQYLLSRREHCNPVLGGQAGNVAWIWHITGADPLIYAPYLSRGVTRTMKRYSSLRWLRFCQFVEGSLNTQDLSKFQTGVLKRAPTASKGLCLAPSGGSLILVKGDRRLILQLDGFQDQDHKHLPFKQVQVHLDHQSIPEVKPADQDHHTWPPISLFSECWIDTETKTLVVQGIGDEGLRQGFQEQVGFAVIGGLDTLFHEYWASEKAVQEPLVEAARAQLRTLAHAGVKIGIELSRIPTPEYLAFLRDLCHRGIVTALGVNGLDELPALVQNEALNQENRIFNPQTAPLGLRTEARQSTPGPHFEYITYLRARGLAQWLGVKYLYVHTNTVDLVLQRGADQAALQKAQWGCMKGKGWVLGALLLRNWPDDPYRPGCKLPPAVKPEGMARLGCFVLDFARQHNLSDEATLLMLATGIAMGSPGQAYSVAAVPVMWPSMNPAEPAQRPELPSGLNTTGAGDMTFAAFMLFCTS